MASQNITAFGTVALGDMAGDWYLPVAKVGIRTKKLLASTALGGGGSGIQTITTDATAARTLLLGDAGVLLKMTSGSANTITVPPNASVPFQIGTRIDIVMYGVGQTSFVAGAGVTINPPTGLDMDGQYSKSTLQKIATDEWLLTGGGAGAGGGGGGTELLDENDVVLEDENGVSLEEE